MKKKTNTLLVGLGLIMASILVSGSYFAESVSAYTASITTSNSIELDIVPGGDGTSIHSESINVQSDCRAGYNLTVATPEGSSLYANGDNTKTASFTAVDGTSALSSNNNTNKWGYTLTSDPDGSIVFSPLSSTASILKTSSQTASPEADINDTFIINYGAKVDNTVEAGTYQMANNGAIVYYLTMDTTCTQYTVSFNPNGGTGTIENQPMQTGEPAKLASSDSLTAPTTASYTDANNNTITGDPGKLWTFWGWNTQADGTGDWYKDREEVENLTSVGSNIALYAQWKQATLADLVVGTQVGTEKVINHNEMQDMSPETCYNSTAYSTDTSVDAHNPYDPSTNPNGYHTITLLDYRGKITTGENPELPESYTVSKLPDNVCWMTKDLNLGRESSGANNNGTVTLTSDDTDLADNTSFTLPASPTTYTTGTAGYITPQILINHTVTSYTVNNISYSPTISHYSWAAATATDTTISASENITTSICPKNWDLPTRTQFYNLRNKGSVSSATIAHSAPYNFVYGGYRNAANGYYNQTSYGYYWTSSNRSSGYGYWSYTYSSGIYDGLTLSGYKYFGAKMRCVASQGKVTVNYDGNGTNEYPVSGTTASQENVGIGYTNTMSSGFTRDNWVFNGWNTAADGTGIAISAGVAIANLSPEPGSTITLYAQWLPRYTITYVNNCMNYASVNTSCTATMSNNTDTQYIDLTSSGDGSASLAGYNKWALNGWKIKGWSIVADNSSDANTEYSVGSSYSVTGQSAGSGITLYAHWVPVYAIQYDGNGADNPNGMGTTDVNGVKSVKQINVGETDSVVLLASNFKRAGYGFVGWSTNPSATVGGNDKIYGPTETIIAPANPNNASNVLTMYAIWVPALKSGGNPVYLQDYEVSDCNNLTSASYDETLDSVTVGSVIALTDKRDNEVYAIARMTDGRCWMMENLRLESAGTLGNNINDSSVTNQSLSQGFGGAPGTYGSFVGLANPESSNFGGTLANGIYKSSANPPADMYNPSNNTLEDIGTADYPGTRFPRYNDSNTKSLVDSTTYTQDYSNASSPSDSGDNYRNSNVYSYGNYYTWAAAIANTSYSVDELGSEAFATSICPFGWHLPSSQSSGNDFEQVKEFATLSRANGGYGGTANESGLTSSERFRRFPNNFPNSGYFRDSYTLNRGIRGSYWSRSASSGYSSANSLVLNSSGMELWSSNRIYGLTVRCLAGSVYTIRYDGNNATGGSMVSNGEELKHVGVIDDRDVKLYAPNYYKTNYSFIGWSPNPNATIGGNDPIYGPNETIKAPSYARYGVEIDGVKTVKLYAIWMMADSNKTMQTFDNTACRAMPQVIFNKTTGGITTPSGSVVALKDQRDNNVYTVARLADGNCWMVDNLRLESANSSDATKAQGFGGVFVGLDAPENTTGGSSTINSLYSSSNITGSHLSNRLPKYSNNNTNSSFAASHDAATPMGSTTYYSWYSYGNYYTWAAAMANTDDYTDDQLYSEAAGTSICPSNWHLPSGSGWSKEFGVLAESYDDNTQSRDTGEVKSRRLRAFPNNFVLSGHLSLGSAIDGRGNSSGWWSRSSAGINSSFHVSMSSSQFTPYYSYNGSKTMGYSVRCLVSGS